MKLENRMKHLVHLTPHQFNMLPLSEQKTAIELLTAYGILLSHVSADDGYSALGLNQCRYDADTVHLRLQCFHTLYEQKRKASTRFVKTILNLRGGMTNDLFKAFA